MEKPKLLIIVLFQNLIDEKPYYALTPAPPLPGILLAALTPPVVEVEVLHEMVRPINYNTDADYIAISFMDYLAPHAVEVAQRFRNAGKIIIGGGKFASTFPDKIEAHFDSILVGEAQTIWPRMVMDLVEKKLKKRYVAEYDESLNNIPPPRYDLVESKYSVPIVIETSRGCTHSCTYCQLNIKPVPFRTRPIKDVINDLKNTKKLPWFKRKMAMILDNHFGGNLENAKKLLCEIAKLKFWAVGVQYSIECLRDPEFIKLLSESNCRMSFIGMESLNSQSLRSVNKKQNKVEEYKTFFHSLKTNGILSFVGLMFALEDDTVEYYEKLPELLDEIGVDVILPSIAIPIYGTPLYNSVNEEGRIVDYDISHYEGDHVVFKHKHLSTNEIYEAYKRVNKIFYSPRKILKRWIKIISKQRIKESIPQYILKILVLTFVYFKLSVFQRHHAIKRIFTNTVSEDIRREKEVLNFPGVISIQESTP
ncbi:B12-binding domain-containing radical SAM protein [Bacteroidota bacterium]